MASESLLTTPRTQADEGWPETEIPWLSVTPRLSGWLPSESLSFEDLIRIGVASYLVTSQAVPSLSASRLEFARYPLLLTCGL